MPDHSPSTDERASLAQPSQSSSPLECTSHLGFSLGGQVCRCPRAPPEVGDLGAAAADSVRGSPICPMHQDDPQSSKRSTEAMRGLPARFLSQQGDEEAGKGCKTWLR